jgi:hypothetical protein
MMIEGSGSRAGSGSGSIPLTSDPDPDPGGPKTCGSGGSGSGFGSGSATLLATVHFLDSVLYLRLKVRYLAPKILYPKPSNTAEYVDEI